MAPGRRRSLNRRREAWRLPGRLQRQPLGFRFQSRLLHQGHAVAERVPDPPRPLLDDVDQLVSDQHASLDGRGLELARGEMDLRAAGERQGSHGGHVTPDVHPDIREVGAQGSLHLVAQGSGQRLSRDALAQPQRRGRQGDGVRVVRRAGRLDGRGPGWRDGPLDRRGVPSQRRGHVRRHRASRRGRMGLNEPGARRERGPSSRKESLHYQGAACRMHGETFSFREQNHIRAKSSSLGEIAESLPTVGDQ